MSGALAAVLVALVAAAPPIAATGPLRLELPLVDAPYGTAHGWRAPSMAQAAAVSRDLHTATDWAIDLGVAGACEGRACGRSPARRWTLETVSILAADALVMQLPAYAVWGHEEYHRAVLGQYGIDSRDDIYGHGIGLSSIYVSHVTDDELAALKRDHPADMVRLSAAGMGGDIELTRAVQADGCFDGVDGRRDVATLALTRARVVRYMWLCDSREATETTNADDAREPDPATRDIVGLDCDAWAYDVQRPDEPYAARGPHPTGVGIDRDRTPEDLTPKERGLLTQARWLSLLNLVDPAMLGVAWPVPLAPEGWRMTAGLAHQLTSFGQAITLDLYGRGEAARWRAALRLYLSGHLALPGLELEPVRLARTVGGARLEATPTVGLWLQPAHDRFDDTAAAPGALARLRLAWLATPRLSAYAEALVKSAGWVAGTPRLGAGVEARLGIGGML